MIKRKSKVGVIEIDSYPELIITKYPVKAYYPFIHEILEGTIVVYKSIHSGLTVSFEPSSETSWDEMTFDERKLVSADILAKFKDEAR